MDELLTVPELANHLKVPVATIYTWRPKGEGPAGIRVGRYVRFRCEDVDRWPTDHKGEPK